MKRKKESRPRKSKSYINPLNRITLGKHEFEEYMTDHWGENQ